MDSKYANMCNIILKNIGDRKLALRWKSKDIEDAIYKNCGLKADIYFSMDKVKYGKDGTVYQSELYGKSDKYYAVILSPWNKNDYEQMLRGGYNEYNDFIFTGPEPKIITSDSKLKHYEDRFGNILDAQSVANIRFKSQNANINIGKNVKFSTNLVIEAGENSKISIADNVVIKTPLIRVGKDANLKIESNVNIGGFYLCINELSSFQIGSHTTLQNGRLQTGRNKKIVIGNDCMFSWDIVILPHDGHLIWELDNQQFCNNTVGKQELSIEIGDHCWIGGESVIMPNTYIGSGSILGYRCMAKGKYPNNCIIVGQPGRVVKKNIAWMRRAVSYDDNDILLIDSQYRKATEDGV